VYCIELRLIMSNEHNSPKRSRLWLNRTFVVVIIILLAVVINYQQLINSKVEEMIGFIENDETSRDWYNIISLAMRNLEELVKSAMRISDELVKLAMRSLDESYRIVLGIFGLISFVFSKVFGSSGSTTYNNKNTTVRPNYSSNTNDSAKTVETVTKINDATNQDQTDRRIE
jgi:hypothetical protein